MVFILSEYSFYQMKRKNRLKELRTSKNLTLKELGKAVGMRDNTLSQYENGKREPKKETWEKLANFFDVSVDYITGFSSEKWSTFSLIEENLKNIVFSEDNKKNEDIKNKLLDCFALLDDEIQNIKIDNEYDDDDPLG